MPSTQHLRLNSAVKNNDGGCRANLSHPVLATAKIGQILPIMAEPTLPGDHFNVRINQFARFMPLSVPSYVRLNYRTMSVFVPYHQIADGCESYFSNQKLFKGVSNALPKIQNTVFNAFLQDNTISVPAENVESAEILFGTNTYKNFTAFGHYVVKVLHLLGYRWRMKDADGNLIAASFLPQSNALPILAFAHAYNSYLAYSATYNVSALSNVLELIKRRSTEDNYVTTAELKTIFTSILLTYEESIFSSAWKQPYMSVPNQSYSQYRDVEGSPLAQSGSDYQVLMEDGDGATASTHGDFISAQQMRLLMKYDEYFRRSNYAGSKDVEQIYSRFGVKIDDYKTRYPYFLGESSQEVKIGDVTSTSHTAEAVIGDYAGKAISDGQCGFNFDSKDYGMLFTFAWFAPRPLYANGIDKEVMRLTPFDFYTPEFDQGFASAIMQGQFDTDATNPWTTSFGYHPVYSEYLYSNAKIVGDFERFRGMEAWHFGRTSRELFDVTAQSDKLIYMSNSGTPFERIFHVEDTDLVDADSIYMTIDVNCMAHRPMKDYTGKTLLGEGNISLPNMGSQIN